MKNHQKRINETKYDALLTAIMSDENAPTISDEKITELLIFFEENQQKIKKPLIRLIDIVSNISIQDLFGESQNLLDNISNEFEKIDTTIDEFLREMGLLSDYLIDSENEDVYKKSVDILNEYEKISSASNGVNLIIAGLKDLIDNVKEQSHDEVANMISLGRNPFEIV